GAPAVLALVAGARPDHGPAAAAADDPVILTEGVLPTAGRRKRQRGLTLRAGGGDRQLDELTALVVLLAAVELGAGLLAHVLGDDPDLALFLFGQELRRQPANHVVDDR